MSKELKNSEVSQSETKKVVKTTAFAAKIKAARNQLDQESAQLAAVVERINDICSVAGETLRTMYGFSITNVTKVVDVMGISTEIADGFDDLMDDAIAKATGSTIKMRNLSEGETKLVTYESCLGNVFSQIVLQLEANENALTSVERKPIKAECIANLTMLKKEVGRKMALRHVTPEALLAVLDKSIISFAQKSVNSFASAIASEYQIPAADAQAQVMKLISFDEIIKDVQKALSKPAKVVASATINVK